MRKDIVFGIRPVVEAIEAGKEIEKVFIKRGLRGDLSQSLINRLKNTSIPFQFVPIEKLNRISRVNHQGVIALISTVSYYDISSIIPTLYEEGETPLILVMDSITDVRNFGAIARTAECAGVHAIVIPMKGGAMVGADAIKTSSGALHTIPLCRSENLSKTLEFLKESGLSVAAASEKGDTLYYRAELKEPLVLIMGSEDKGVSAPLLRMADQILKIPVLGKISSLNVSAATSVILYEAVRQRATAVKPPN